MPYLVLIRVSPSGLSHKEPGAFFQLHLIWRALKADPLVLLTVQVEDNFILLHADGKACPLVEQGGHGEVGRCIRTWGAWLRVVEDDVLLARPQLRQLDTHIDDALRRVRDSKEHSSPRGGGLDVEQEGEVPVERARKVVPRHLARVGIGAEYVARVVVRAIDLEDLIWGGVSDQLQEANLGPQVLCKMKGKGWSQPAQWGWSTPASCLGGHHWPCLPCRLGKAAMPIKLHCLDVTPKMLPALKPQLGEL